MLHLLIGFVIAVIIALTGVGAGVVTAPLLILFLHVPVEIAVSTALAYAAIVKLIVVPVQMARKQVSYRILGWMLLGGVPGVILGSLLGIDAAALADQSFLAYTHVTAEALSRVATGEVQAAFLMNPTKVEEVLAVCEAGLVLPQKSTYFQPKLATGLLMYGLDGPAPR